MCLHLHWYALCLLWMDFHPHLYIDTCFSLFNLRTPKNKQTKKDNSNIDFNI
jgi:hypothetical protein